MCFSGKPSPTISTRCRLTRMRLFSILDAARESSRVPLRVEAIEVPHLS
jgi:hypothetical protein